MGAEAGRLVRDKTSLGKKAAHDRNENKKKRVIELGEMDLTSDNLDLVHPKSPKVKSPQGEKVPRKEKKKPLLAGVMRRSTARLQCLIQAKEIDKSEDRRSKRPLQGINQILLASQMEKGTFKGGRAQNKKKAPGYDSSRTDKIGKGCVAA